jgi:GT2 family glycosyltransferase
VSVTALVLSVDEAAYLEECLPAVAGQADVVVIDNACGDASAEVAERFGARVVRLDSRRSYAAAINAGIAATSGELVLLLNADCVVREGFVSALRDALVADPRLGSAAPKLLRAEAPGAIDAAGVVVDARRKNLLVGHGAPASAYAAAGRVFGADGAAALWRRAALEDCAIGAEVLDEDKGLWATESDLAWRAHLRGWGCVYEPRAEATHVRTYSPSTPRAQLAAEHRRLQFRNRLLMVFKNQRWPTPALLAYELAALGHALLRERELLGAYRDVWRARGALRRRRRVVQSRRTARPPFGLRPDPRGP